ncbi:hypothetical protein [Leptospira interrogans]|uniref:hypothetical protein n=1 Tax=Leptospira interrogans TaxID=173 RepID=UPI003C12FB57
MINVLRKIHLSIFHIIIFLTIPFLATCSLFEKDRNTMENVDLAGAIWLAAEPVKTQVNNEGVVKPGKTRKLWNWRSGFHTSNTRRRNFQPTSR